MSTRQNEASTPSRRGFLKFVSASMGAAASGPALADTLADVPPREQGADLSGHSERSPYIKITRIPEAGPGLRHVDPDDAINSKTPIGQLVGSITPTDLHYERSHSGVPNLDPAKHRLLMHGMVSKPLVLTVNDLKAMPSTSRVVFIECTGNGWENWNPGRHCPSGIQPCPQRGDFHAAVRSRNPACIW
jgi:sulfane dehydrogenase subunit SoxC